MLQRLFPLLVLMLLAGCADEAAPEATPAADSTGTAAPATSTDIWLVALPADLTQLDPATATHVTPRPGYDNQPSFTPDGQMMLFTAQHGDQTDIYTYDLATGTTTQRTDTPTSEYSPTVMPSGDTFSVIQVESDGTQRLWSFAMTDASPEVILPDIAPVGYHAWATPETLALFVLGDPPTLQQATPGPGTGTVVAEGIGRSIHRIPGTEAISFVHKRSEDDWQITRYDPVDGSLTPLIATLPGREDYAWMPDGTLLMADATVLHAAVPGATTWLPLADFADAGLADLTRLAVSPDGTHLALVASE